MKNEKLHRISMSIFHLLSTIHAYVMIPLDKPCICPWGVFKLRVLQWLRILDYIFIAYCAHRAILIKMAIFETILLMNSYEI